MSHHTAPAEPDNQGTVDVTSDSPQWPPRPWQHEQLFFNASLYFEDLLAHIARAQSSIVIETYIFDYDSLGKRLISALFAAHQRGVSIRVLMDGVGSSSDSDRTAAALESHGIPVKIFRPLPWHIYHYRRALKAGSLINKLLHFAHRINQRNHRKQVIIDNRYLWSGSLNISVKHLPVEDGGEGWQDYGVRVSGEHITSLAGQFDDVWHRRPIRLGKGVFQYCWHTLSAWSRARKNHLLLSRINGAQYRIQIVTAYFAPASAIIRALKQARRRGVDVEVLVTGVSDVRLFPLLTASYYADLLKSDIKIFEYQPGFMHAKALLIDDFALLGSTNFNHRSYLHDQELDIVLTEPDSLSQLKQQIQRDRLASTEIIFNANKSWRWKVLGWLPRLLRYWM